MISQAVLDQNQQQHAEVRVTRGLITGLVQITRKNTAYAMPHSAFAAIIDTLQEP